MNPKSKEFIGQHIEKIIQEFNFQNQVKKNPDTCPCYEMGKSCHDKFLDKEKHNCFFCYCPSYDNSTSEGGCKIGNPYGSGKIFEFEDSEGNPRKVWDCSNCSWPHEEENVRKILFKLFSGKLDLSGIGNKDKFLN